MKHYLIAFTSLFIGLTQLAQGAAAAPLPEPGTLELLALGGVVAAVVALRKRHNKN